MDLGLQGQMWLKKSNFQVLPYWKYKTTIKPVWYKTKFGSQILATNFGVFFMIYVMF